MNKNSNIGKRVTAPSGNYIVLGESKLKHTDSEIYILSKIEYGGTLKPIDLKMQLWRELRNIKNNISYEITSVKLVNEDKFFELVNKYCLNFINWGYKESYTFINVKSILINVLEDDYE